jgi:hypothetical protein
MEQLKQMQQKKEAERKALQSERDFFFNVGLKATDKYYVNEDRRKEQQMSLKGGSKVQAEVIKEKFMTA